MIIFVVAGFLYPILYNFVYRNGILEDTPIAVVDDAACGVSEVVRGRDLLSSTPVQLWLYRVLGLTPPTFTHVPMLLSTDGRRLSKGVAAGEGDRPAGLALRPNRPLGGGIAPGAGGGFRLESRPPGGHRDGAASMIMHNTPKILVVSLFFCYNTHS